MYTRYNVLRINYSYMKKIKYLAITSVSTMAMVPLMASAGDNTFGSPALSAFLNSVLTFINSALIPFIFGVAFLVFVWGMFQYFIVGGSNDEAKEKGKSLLTYSILGFVIILVFWGIINLVVGATGLEGNQFQADLLPATPTLVK